MKQLYPTFILNRNDESEHPFLVCVPDMEIFTEGDAFADTIEMATSALDPRTTSSILELIIGVKEGNENSEAIKALVDALKSVEIQNYINETYDGAVIPFEG